MRTKTPMCTKDEVIELVEKLYKYQDFKSSTIPFYIKSDTYKGSSLKALHSLVRRYLACGKKDLKRTPPLFYATIDSLKLKFYPKLTPSKKDEARPYKEHLIPEKAQVYNMEPQEMEEPKQQVKSTNTDKFSNETLERIKFLRNEKNTYLGLRLDDNLQIFKNEDEISGYLRAFKDREESKDFKKVRITIEEI